MHQIVENILKNMLIESFYPKNISVFYYALSLANMLNHNL